MCHSVGSAMNSLVLVFSFVLNKFYGLWLWATDDDDDDGGMKSERQIVR